MLIKVVFIWAVPRDLQQYFEYFFLCTLHHESKLIYNNCNGTALEHGWRIFLHDLFETFDAGFWQLNKTNALLHHLGHSFYKAGVDEVVHERRKDVHERGKTLNGEKLDLETQIRHHFFVYDLNQNIHKLLCHKSVHLVFLRVLQCILQVHGSLIDHDLIFVFEQLDDHAPVRLLIWVVHFQIVVIIQRFVVFCQIIGCIFSDKQIKIFSNWLINSFIIFQNLEKVLEYYLIKTFEHIYLYIWKIHLLRFWNNIAFTVIKSLFTF